MITPFGLYEFKRMPFGFTNAPATFERLIESCLGDPIFSTCLVYPGDVIVFARSFPEISERLEEVLGEQGWRSGESTRIPPMWPGLDSRTRCHMWVKFVVVSRPCSEGVSPGSPVFLPPQKPTASISNLTRNTWTRLNEFEELFGA